MIIRLMIMLVSGLDELELLLPLRQVLLLLRLHRLQRRHQLSTAVIPCASDQLGAYAPSD
jgi:hypothetical protein